MSGYQAMVGRDRELAVLAAAASAAAAGRGSLVLVEEAPGIGKTTLLRAACTAAGESGAQVLTARGLALEGGFSYGIVRQLIEPVRAAGPAGHPARAGPGPGPGTQPGRPGGASGRGRAGRDRASARAGRAAGRPGAWHLGRP